MKYSKRIEMICKNLPVCTYFADIGCDHGYCTAFMLENNLCKEAIITDISEKSLKKAEKLLANFLLSGKLKSICTNGLQFVDEKYQQILIAGMGGEEIILILENGFLPETLILQPMKNSNKVRKFLLNKGYTLTKDFTFSDKKFYDLLVAQKGVIKKRKYTHLEIEYGFDNIHTPSKDFIAMIDIEFEKYKNRTLCSNIQKKIIELVQVKNEIKKYFSDT